MKKYKHGEKISFAYLKSMRPYLFFVSGMAGCLGLVFSGRPVSFGRAAAVLSVVFLGWGVNQVINDLLGLPEDKINAPHRPLVTGALPRRPAILLSMFLFILGGIVTFYLNPSALVLYLFVFILNIAYEFSKKIPWLGNIVFSLLLAPCLYYGAMCVNKEGLGIFADKKLFLLATAIIMINIMAAFFTYYKDYRGDKAAGKKTVIVQLGPGKAKYLNHLVSAFPFSVLLFLFYSPVWKDDINPYFLILMLLTFIILQYTAFLFFKRPAGKDAYYSLKWNFRGVVLFKTSFIALVNPLMAGVLYLVNFILVGFLFDLHQDYLA